MSININFLKARKKSLGLTTEDVSIRSGIPMGTLNKIFAGQTLDPKYDTVKLICSALDVSLGELEAADGAESVDSLFIDKYGKEAFDIALKYNRLDASDRIRASERIDTLLDDAKYEKIHLSAKRQFNLFQVGA